MMTVLSTEEDDNLPVEFQTPGNTSADQEKKYSLDDLSGFDLDENVPGPSGLAPKTSSIVGTNSSIGSMINREIDVKARHSDQESSDSFDEEKIFSKGRDRFQKQKQEVNLQKLKKELDGTKLEYEKRHLAKSSKKEKRNEKNRKRKTSWLEKRKKSLLERWGLALSNVKPPPEEIHVNELIENQRKELQGSSPSIDSIDLALNKFGRRATLPRKLDENKARSISDYGFLDKEKKITSGDGRLEKQKPEENLHQKKEELDDTKLKYEKDSLTKRSKKEKKGEKNRKRKASWLEKRKKSLLERWGLPINNVKPPPEEMHLNGLMKNEMKERRGSSKSIDSTVSSCEVTTPRKLDGTKVRSISDYELKFSECNVTKDPQIQRTAKIPAMIKDYANVLKYFKSESMVCGLDASLESNFPPLRPSNSVDKNIEQLPLSTLGVQSNTNIIIEHDKVQNSSSIQLTNINKTNDPAKLRERLDVQIDMKATAAKLAELKELALYGRVLVKVDPDIKKRMENEKEMLLAKTKELDRLKLENKRLEREAKEKKKLQKEVLKKQKNIDKKNTETAIELTALEILKDENEKILEAEKENEAVYKRVTEANYQLLVKERKHENLQKRMAAQEKLKKTLRKKELSQIKHDYKFTKTSHKEEYKRKLEQINQLAGANHSEFTHKYACEKYEKKKALMKESYAIKEEALQAKKNEQEELLKLKQLKSTQEDYKEKFKMKQEIERQKYGWSKKIGIIKTQARVEAAKMKSKIAVEELKLQHTEAGLVKLGKNEKKLDKKLNKLEKEETKELSQIQKFEHKQTKKFKKYEDNQKKKDNKQAMKQDKTELKSMKKDGKRKQKQIEDEVKENVKNMKKENEFKANTAKIEKDKLNLIQNQEERLQTKILNQTSKEDEIIKSYTEKEAKEQLAVLKKVKKHQEKENKKIRNEIKHLEKQQGKRTALELEKLIIAGKAVQAEAEHEADMAIKDLQKNLHLKKLVDEKQIDALLEIKKTNEKLQRDGIKKLTKIKIMKQEGKNKIEDTKRRQKKSYGFEKNQLGHEEIKNKGLVNSQETVIEEHLELKKLKYENKKESRLPQENGEGMRRLESINKRVFHKENGTRNQSVIEKHTQREQTEIKENEQNKKKWEVMKNSSQMQESVTQVCRKEKVTRNNIDDLCTVEANFSKESGENLKAIEEMENKTISQNPNIFPKPPKSKATVGNRRFLRKPNVQSVNPFASIAKETAKESSLSSNEIRASSSRTKEKVTIAPPNNKTAKLLPKYCMNTPHTSNFCNGGTLFPSETTQKCIILSAEKSGKKVPKITKLNEKPKDRLTKVLLKVFKPASLENTKQKKIHEQHAEPTNVGTGPVRCHNIKVVSPNPVKKAGKEETLNLKAAKRFKKKKADNAVQADIKTNESKHEKIPINTKANKTAPTVNLISPRVVALKKEIEEPIAFLKNKIFALKAEIEAEHSGRLAAEERYESAEKLLTTIRIQNRNLEEKIEGEMRDMMEEQRRIIINYSNQRCSCDKPNQMINELRHNLSLCELQLKRKDQLIIEYEMTKRKEMRFKEMYEAANHRIQQMGKYAQRSCSAKKQLNERISVLENMMNVKTLNPIKMVIKTQNSEVRTLGGETEECHSHFQNIKELKNILSYQSKNNADNTLFIDKTFDLINKLVDLNMKLENNLKPGCASGHSDDTKLMLRNILQSFGILRKSVNMLTKALNKEKLTGADSQLPMKESRGEDSAYQKFESPPLVDKSAVKTQEENMSDEDSRYSIVVDTSVLKTQENKETIKDEDSRYSKVVNTSVVKTQENKETIKDEDSRYSKVVNTSVVKAQEKKESIEDEDSSYSKVVDTSIVKTQEKKESIEDEDSRYLQNEIQCENNLDNTRYENNLSKDICYPDAIKHQNDLSFSLTSLALQHGMSKKDTIPPLPVMEEPIIQSSTKKNDPKLKDEEQEQEDLLNRINEALERIEKKNRNKEDLDTLFCEGNANYEETTDEITDDVQNGGESPEDIEFKEKDDNRTVGIGSESFVSLDAGFTFKQPQQQAKEIKKQEAIITNNVYNNSKSSVENKEISASKHLCFLKESVSNQTENECAENTNESDDTIDPAINILSQESEKLRISTEDKKEIVEKLDLSNIQKPQKKDKIETVQEKKKPSWLISLMRNSPVQSDFSFDEVKQPPKEPKAGRRSSVKPEPIETPVRSNGPRKYYPGIEYVNEPTEDEMAEARRIAAEPLPDLFAQLPYFQAKRKREQEQQRTRERLLH